MNRILGMALLAAGVVLIIFGANESHSLGSDISKFFTGNPTDRAMWLLLGGIVACAVGGLLTFLPARRI